MRLRSGSTLLLLVAVTACRPAGGCRGDYCGTLVFASAGEPDILLPTASDQTQARDMFAQLFLKLADIGMSANTIGDRDFEPQLARSWAWEDPLTLVFQVDPRARWHDGVPVRAPDVAFTYEAYTDPRSNTVGFESLKRIASVKARDSLTVAVRFRERYPEMFFDAVYHMWILPKHLLDTVPRQLWATAAFGRAPVGDGPYRFVSWKRGESVELAADSTFFLGRPHIRRLIWRPSADLNTSISQMIAGQADALEILGPPANEQRVRAAKQLALYPYPGLIYGYLAFNLTDPRNHARPHAVLADREVRRALAMAVDREAMLQSVWGQGKVPPGPISQLWNLWDIGIRTLPYDTAAASRVLTERGWRDSDGDGIRDLGGRKLSFEILAPTTSAPRMQYARLLQQQLRSLGVAVTVSEVEYNTFANRQEKGDFDAIMLTYQSDPTPTSSIAQHWRRVAPGNVGRYASAEFERLLDRATAGGATPDSTRAAWRDALSLLNDDAPAIFLFAPNSIATVHKRVVDVRIRPDSWWALVRTWRIPADQLIDRDRVER